MKFKIQNEPRLKLTDLLKRRKMTLKQFIDEFGITTYDGLINRCVRMGVAAPDEADFKPLVSVIVNNPVEGIVVIEPIPVIAERTGEIITIDAIMGDEPHPELVANQGTQLFSASLDDIQKKSKKKKGNPFQNNDE
jgi:hypothetical protein